MEIISSRPAALTEVKNMLRQREKEITEEDEELYYEQKRALEHANKFAKLNLKDTKNLTKQISKLNLELSNEQTIKFGDLLPETVDDVRAIFAKERFKYSAEDIRKILDVVDQYR